MREKLRSIIEDNTTVLGRIFDRFIQFLIILSLVAFTYETYPDNSLATIKILKIIELVSVIIFTIEYLLRVYVSKKPLQYIFSFYGIIDLLAILPFYLSILGITDVSALKAFRVFRVLKLIKYNPALNRFQIAAKLVKEEVFLFLMVTLIFIFLASTGIYFFEHEAQPEVFSSIIHSTWWSIVTLTTVGYGDVYPITMGGKIFTFFILIIGVGIVTIPAGLVASALSKAREIQEKEKISNQIKE